MSSSSAIALWTGQRLLLVRREIVLRELGLLLLPFVEHPPERVARDVVAVAQRVLEVRFDLRSQGHRSSDSSGP